MDTLSPIADIWPPRASAIGNYASCLARAANDRAIHEGKMPDTRKASSTSYADLGTLMHFELQAGLGCVFPGPTADYAPDEDTWLSADRLCGHNREATTRRVRRVAEVAAQHMPKLPPGQVWYAEQAWSMATLTGHTDFRSFDATQGVDLKSTTSKPPKNQVKYEHLWQMAAYYILNGTPLWLVLYVDSAEAAWVVPVWIDFRLPGLRAFAEQARAFIHFLNSDALWDAAWPAIGAHCSKSWCAYRHECHDMYVPVTGERIDMAGFHRPPARISLAGLTPGV